MLNKLVDQMDSGHYHWRSHLYVIFALKNLLKLGMTHKTDYIILEHNLLCLVLKTYRSGTEVNGICHCFVTVSACTLGLLVSCQSIGSHERSDLYNNHTQTDEATEFRPSLCLCLFCLAVNVELRINK